MIWLTVLSWVKRIPWQLWAALILAVAFLWLRSHWIGIGEERCRSAQEAAESQADAKALNVQKAAQDKAQEVIAGIQKETSDVQTEVRTIIKTVPATCPAQPGRLRELGQQQVEAARRRMLPAPSR